MTNGFGDGSGSGYGSGYGSGFGFGFGSGDGFGFYGEPVGWCGPYEATHIRPWALLRVGCEIHSVEHWIEHAEDIDADNGSPGLHEQTRALALKLKEKETSE